MTVSPFILLCITGLFAIFSSTISKSPVLPLFAAHLGAGPSEVGTVAAVSAFAGIVASIPAGLLSDRWGRKRMLVVSAAVFASAPVLYFFVTALWQLALVRFYHGFATALFVPVAMALVSDLFQKNRGEKMGWFSTATLAGRFMAPIIGGSIIAALSPGMGYKAVYLVCGAAGMAVLLLVLGTPAPASRRRESATWSETWNILRSALSHKGIILTSAVEASILFAYGTFETFLPLYSVKSGLSAYAVGMLLSAQIVTLALTKPVMGKFSDRHGRERQIAAGALMGAACIGCISLFRSFIPLLAISILFGLSLSIVTSATSALIADLSRRDGRGSAMGILGSLMDIGHTTGPLVSGIIAAYSGFGMSFAGAALVLAAAALLFRVGAAGRI